MGPAFNAMVRVQVLLRVTTHEEDRGYGGRRPRVDGGSTESAPQDEDAHPSVSKEEVGGSAKMA